MAKTLEEWKDRYYEQQANHTEATGMLAAERDRWIQRAQKAERLIQEHNESCEAACTAQEPRCDCYTSRDLRCPDCPKDWKIETESHARGGAPDLHLHDGPLICKVCATPVSGEGVTEDAGATWMHLRCFKPQPGGAGFKCCGAGDPPCTSFEVSCQNPANYADGERWCPKCKQPDFPFCATSGCLKVPKLAEPPQPGGTD
jgi:hypothetical protein